MSAPHRAGVLGSPIGHSLSPTMYRAGFAACSMVDWSFDAIDCDAEHLPTLVSGLTPEWSGLAVTMPGKEAAARFASGRSDRVQRLGVANTLVRRGDSWWAENTDVDGVLGSLDAAGVEPNGPVLLIGGGGTARAVVAVLAEMQWDGPLILAGRRPESTVIVKNLAATLGLFATQTGMTAEHIAPLASTMALVASTVPAGAADHLADVLAAVPAVFDVIYHPWPTALAAAGQRGRITVTGLDMLLHQALRQFELVTGVPAPADALRAALRTAVGSDLPLLL
ncbi:MAG: shikimate dehydrogenase [Nakamurella sp.]